MKTNERVILRRDCEAIQIPDGNVVALPTGSEVRIMQSLGGTYTVMTSNGSLVRIAGADADALGKETAVESLAGASTTPAGPAGIEQLVWDQLRTCFDPEIPVNIVDLGLVYEVNIGRDSVGVIMTLTAIGCPVAGEVMAEVETKLLEVPGVKMAKVELTFDPPWTPERMSEDARWELGMS